MKFIEKLGVVVRLISVLCSCLMCTKSFLRPIWPWLVTRPSYDYRTNIVRASYDHRTTIVDHPDLMYSDCVILIIAPTPGITIVRTSYDHRTTIVCSPRTIADSIRPSYDLITTQDEKNILGQSLDFQETSIWRVMTNTVIYLSMCV